MNKEKVANLMSATLVQTIIENERAKNRLFLLRLMGALLVLQLPAGAAISEPRDERSVASM